MAGDPTEQPLRFTNTTAAAHVTYETENAFFSWLRVLQYALYRHQAVSAHENALRLFTVLQLLSTAGTIYPPTQPRVTRHPSTQSAQLAVCLFGCSILDFGSTYAVSFVVVNN